MFCSNCSEEMSAEAKACPKCGHPNKVFEKRSKTVFVLLALFLGGLGIHRMYIGDWFLGVIYLLFFWTYVPMIVALIEAIVIGFRKGDQRFNT